MRPQARAGSRRATARPPIRTDKSVGEELPSVFRCWGTELQVRISHLEQRHELIYIC